MNEIKTIENNAVNVSVDINSLLQMSIEKDISIETITKFFELRDRLKKEWAEEQYNTSMCSFQSECPKMKRTKIVLNKDEKTERYRYAPLEEISETIKPLLIKHGFSYTFDVDQSIKGEVKVICIISHKCGHTKQTPFSVPIQVDGYMSAPQKVASALTFSKRYALCDGFGIVSGDDDDDNQLGIEDNIIEPENKTNNQSKKPSKQEPIDYTRRKNAKASIINRALILMNNKKLTTVEQNYYKSLSSEKIELYTKEKHLSELKAIELLENKYKEPVGLSLTDENDKEPNFDSFENNKNNDDLPLGVS